MKYKGALGLSGVADWVMQRVSAIIIAAYLIYLVLFFYCFTTHNTHAYVDYEDWVNLFDSFTFKVFTSVFLFFLVKHAWIGLWTVVTDYIHGFKLRTLVLFIGRVACLAYLGWGLYIVW